MYIIKENGWLW